MILGILNALISLIERLVDKHTDIEREIDDLGARVGVLEALEASEPAPA
jgi:hypothetical protein